MKNIDELAHESLQNFKTHKRNSIYASRNLIY